MGRGEGGRTCAVEGFMPFLRHNVHYSAELVFCHEKRTDYYWKPGKYYTAQIHRYNDYLIAATKACSLSALAFFFCFLAKGFLGAGRDATSFAQAENLLYLAAFLCVRASMSNAH